MKWTNFYIALCLVIVTMADESGDIEEELRLATACNEDTCRLPDCRCSSTGIPGAIPARNTPQFVVITFDDGINYLNHQTYKEIIYGRQNTNGCSAGTTFFINHEYTNYEIVNELYNYGYEIALHSISHQTPQTYWQEATVEDMRREIADQRVQMSHFANIPIDEIKGVRLPFLQLSGNNSFIVMSESGLLYDSTWPTITYTNPGLWPYTLDYASTQDCLVAPPCPSAAIPGVWVIPMISWSDLQNFPCSMVDACFHRPNLEDEEGWFQFILSNFERHYLGNRAPFPFYIHESFLSPNPAVQRALVRFMNLINSLHDVFMVNSAEVIEWVKNPMSVIQYLSKPCRTFEQTTCDASRCGPYAINEHQVQHLDICTACPANYPWLGNPLGD